MPKCSVQYQSSLKKSMNEGLILEHVVQKRASKQRPQIHNKRFYNQEQFSSFSCGRWTPEEQKQYIKFIADNIEQLRTKTQRKSQKIFLKMSRSIRSRNAQQCRTHHQKMIKFNGGIQQIMASYHDIDTRCNKVMELRNKKSVTPPTVDTSMEDDQAVSVRLLSNNVIRIEIRAESIESY